MGRGKQAERVRGLESGRMVVRVLRKYDWLFVLFFFGFGIFTLCSRVHLWSASALAK